MNKKDVEKLMKNPLIKEALEKHEAKKGNRYDIRDNLGDRLIKKIQDVLLKGDRK